MTNMDEIKPAKGNNKIEPGILISSIAVPVIAGSVSGLLTSGAMRDYRLMKKPPLAPPAVLFPIVWTVLYIMMGLACYYIYVTETEESLKNRAILFYALQLGMNFCWSIFFFSFSLYLLSYFWLLGLLLMTVLCTVTFFRIRKIAGAMLLPYILWLSFASYLNCAAYILNKAAA